MKYDNFFLPVNNLNDAKRFYNEVMEMELKFDFSSAGMVAYNVGDEEPALILKDVSKFKNTKPTIWFVVENVIAEYEKLKNKGVVFLSKPFEIRTGMSAEFEDPFGNRLGITDYSKMAE